MNRPRNTTMLEVKPSIPRGRAARYAAWCVFVAAMFGSIARAEDSAPPQIVHEPCEHYKKGEAFVVEARFYDDSPLFEPKVLYRARRDSSWRTSPFLSDPNTNAHRAIIPAKDLRGSIEYFIEAFDENGNGPAQFGSPEAPIRVKPSDRPPACTQVSDAPFETVAGGAGAGHVTLVAPPRPVTSAASTATSGPAPPPAASGCDAATPPVYCSPWLWGSVGAVLLLGGGVVFALAQRGDEAPAGRPAYVGLRVAGADPTSTLELRAGAP